MIFLSYGDKSLDNILFLVYVSWGLKKVNWTHLTSEFMITYFLNTFFLVLFIIAFSFSPSECMKTHSLWKHTVFAVISRQGTKLHLQTISMKFPFNLVEVAATYGCWGSIRLSHLWFEYIMFVRWHLISLLQELRLWAQIEDFSFYCRFWVDQKFNAFNCCVCILSIILFHFAVSNLVKSVVLQLIEF